MANVWIVVERLPNTARHNHIWGVFTSREEAEKHIREDEIDVKAQGVLAVECYFLNGKE